MINGELRQLLPNPFRKGSYFNGAVIYEIPSAEDQFELEVEPPFGQERIIVYASTAPLGEIDITPDAGVCKINTNQPLPRNLLWACDQADAKSKDVVAAWIIELKPKDPRRKSLSIAFPAFPKIEDCQNFTGVIYSRIDPLTDKIIRQKINISVIQEEISDSPKPLKWGAQVSLVDESFNIKLVKQGDLGK